MCCRTKQNLLDSVFWSLDTRFKCVEFNQLPKDCHQAGWPQRVATGWRRTCQLSHRQIKRPSSPIWENFGIEGLQPDNSTNGGAAKTEGSSEEAARGDDDVVINVFRCPADILGTTVSGEEAEPIHLGTVPDRQWATRWFGEHSPAARHCAGPPTLQCQCWERLLRY